jgi:uncharacterized repeat protein (TIGR02543 family)
MIKPLLKILLVLVAVYGAHGASYIHAATVSLPKTGQTGCWDVNGNVVDCTTNLLANGQDGKLQKGVALPVPRFTDNSNGTVTDNLTGLIWLKDAGCFATVGGITKGTNAASSYLTWANALTWSNNLKNGDCALADASVAGDWRLPNRKELQSLIDRQNVNPALPVNHFFSAVQAYYWSSTTYAYGTDYAWGVGMDDGFVINFNKTSYFYYVWPVRGGQSGALGSLSLSPTSKDFGSIVTNNTSAVQSFILSNSGTGNLVVSAITLTGADSSMFTLTTGDGTAGTCGATPTIAAAGSCTVSATFTPTSTGSKATTLRIASNDPVNPTKDIALSGTGVLPSYTIGTSVVGGNGTITCDSPVVSGGTSNCTISGITAGYHLATFTDNSVDKLSSVVTNAYTITNVTGDHLVAGTFAVDTHTVSFSSNGGTAVSSQAVTYNTVATAPADPTKTGSTFAGWCSDAALTSAFAFTTPITADTTLYAKWAINTYTATPTPGTGSSMTPATAQTVNSGATTSFTVTPLDGYGILSATGCNGTLSGTTYTTGAMTANCAVAVTAVKKDANSGTAAEPTIADALKALQTYSGIIQLTPEETIRYDVAPLGANGVPQGNGVVDVADVIMILRRSIGIGSW